MADRLIDIARNNDGRLVAPLMGFPGIQLNGTSLKQNMFNWGTQFSTLFALERRFRPDAMFFFMDLSVEASALGLQVRFPLLESPTVEGHPIRNIEDLERFPVADVLSDGRVAVYIETMRLMSRYLDVLKCGYVIGPFTLAGLLMGASEASMATVMTPELLHQVLGFAAGVISRYARALDRAGADLIAILEPTASFLSPKAFREFSGRYVSEIISSMQAIPVLHICGQTTKLLDGMVETGVQGLSLGNLVDFPEVAKRIPQDVMLIGNLDPVRVLKDMTPNGVFRVTHDLLDAMEPYENFILSTGCDLPADVPLENIHAMMDAGRGHHRAGRPLAREEDEIDDLTGVFDEVRRAIRGRQDEAE